MCAVSTNVAVVLDDLFTGSNQQGFNLNVLLTQQYWPLMYIYTKIKKNTKINVLQLYL